MQALQHDRKSAVNRRGKNDKLDERLKRLARKHSFDPQVRGANAKHVLPKPRSSKAKGKDGDGAPNSRGHRCVRANRVGGPWVVACVVTCVNPVAPLPCAGVLTPTRQ